MRGSSLLGVAGMVRLEVTGAAPEDFLTLLARNSVRFRRLRQVDELSLRLEVFSGDMGLVRKCAKKSMCGMEILGVTGLVPFLRAMGWRLLYPAVLAALVGLVFWLQGHIWFFSVSGNVTVPDAVILRALEDQDVGFWTVADDLDLNLIKNRTLAALPELSWITVNTRGGMAEVVVREREEKPALQRSAAPANLVARRSGLITRVQANRGTAQVQKGDLVQAGDLLISGVTALDQTMLLTRAEGEIYARTWSRVTAVLPENRAEKVYSGRETVRWSLTVGKKTINFFQTSGISYGSYDKIRETTVLTLPGGYAFPLSVTRFCFREYAPAYRETDLEEAETALEAAMLDQLRQGLTAGSIRSSRTEVTPSPAGYALHGTVECQEEIGMISEILE